MKSYKVKSIVYFSLFAAVATYYYTLEQEDNFQDKITNQEFVDIQPEDLEDLESEDLKTP